MACSGVTPSSVPKRRFETWSPNISEICPVPPRARAFPKYSSFGPDS